MFLKYDFLSLWVIKSRLLLQIAVLFNFKLNSQHKKECRNWRGVNIFWNKCVSDDTDCTYIYLDDGKAQNDQHGISQRILYEALHLGLTTLKHIHKYSYYTNMHMDFVA